jgi:hypothetical protein
LNQDGTECRHIANDLIAVSAAPGGATAQADFSWPAANSPFPRNMAKLLANSFKNELAEQ